MASMNPFALLADDDGSDNEQQVQQVKPSKPAVVDAAPKDGKAPKVSGGIPQATARRNVPGQTSRPQRDQQPREIQATDAPAGVEGERGRDDRGTGFGRGRGGRGGRGGDRGTRGARGGARGGKFDRPDRRSQTGRVDSEKAEHQGWGGDEGKRELEAETAGVTDAVAEKTNDGEAATPTGWEVSTEETPAASGWDAPAAISGDAEATADKAPEREPEPEDNSKTYEQFLAEQKAAGRGVLDTLSTNARKANEGSDDSQWKDGVLVKKGDRDEGFFADLQKEKANKAKKDRKEKNLLEVEFTAPARQGFNQDRRGGAPRGRGGRGRGEGRGDGTRGRGAAGGRGGRGRGGASQANGVNIADNTAFPSLS